MALLKSSLTKDLIIIFSNPTNNIQQGTQRLAAAYAKYAATAQSCQAQFPQPAAITAAQTTFQKKLEILASKNYADLNENILTLSNALSEFWLSPPMVFTGSPPGLVTLAIPPIGLITQTFFANSTSDPKKGADRLATALDTFTRTVSVTHAAVCSGLLI